MNDMKSCIQDGTRLAAVYLVAALGGWLMARIGAPLPWMIGALIFTALLYLTQFARLTIPARTRPVGQLIVAIQVGLAFSPTAFEQLISLAPLLVGLAAVTAFASLAVSIILSRMSGMPLVTSFLSTIPASPVEAAVLAQKYGLQTGPIVFSQILRIASVVILIPIALYAVDGWPERSLTVQSALHDPMGMLTLIIAGVVSATAFRILGISNPNFLGPLAAAAVMSASGVPPAPFPPVVLAAAQIVLGTWLGSCFKPALFANAGRLVGSVMVSTLLCLVLTTGFGVALGHFINVPWEDMVLGAAPGGITELSLTAKFLARDVPFVAACHIVRIFLIVPALPFGVAVIRRCINFKPT
ncbi:AbrB family transcriptional regulator [Sinorhizobium mexicanum]|uniref:AbrB family transcriptional regulator n=1 Tax=Sinorhizobium mexicanum TaxID=375549 RepID=A0A859QKV7_9HYPH|nr:AbrB family transcriptional regulator [Sinorhizobium mexicanum]MBP1888074.1 membrane AbrB-like protein [Sinorhizobium mexicanum]QLL65684.1 AbrB family transcriptional regulator [Sinorhizobium mexicanum]